MKIYGKVRSPSLIDRLFSLGICISYLRVLEITKCISQTLLQQYDHRHVFLQRASCEGIFTVIAKDNIELNASSTTASNHYHGTSMSVLQFPRNEVPAVQNEYSFDMTGNCESLKIDKLPDTHTCIEKLPYPNVHATYDPLRTTVVPDFEFEVLRIAIEEEFIWLSQLGIIGWSVQHASMHRSLVKQVDITTILPLIREKVHTLYNHCMDVISKTIKVINPGQTPVDVCDQPVCAFTKQIQWKFPA